MESQIDMCTFEKKDLYIDLNNILKDDIIDDDRSIFLKAKKLLETSLNEEDFFRCLVISFKLNIPLVEMT